MTGGRSWEKLPVILKNNSSKLPLLNGLQGPIEECGFPSRVSAWILKNLHHVSHETYALINKLISDDVKFPEEYLTLSCAVIIDDCLEEFIELYQVNRHWIFY